MPGLSTSSPSVNDLSDGRTRRYWLRAFLALGVWLTPTLQVALGVARCSFATIFRLPCPGCGLTRSAHLLLEAKIFESLRMHPLLIPIVLSHGLLAVATIWATWRDGTPFEFYRNRAGRFALWFFGSVYCAVLIVWIARFFGLLGGPVPV